MIDQFRTGPPAESLGSPGPAAFSGRELAQELLQTPEDINPTPGELPNPKDNPQAYIEAVDGLDPPARAKALERLRLNREVAAYRASDYSLNLDVVILELIRADKLDTAKALLTPSVREPIRIEWAIDRLLVLSQDERQRLQQIAHQLVEQKTEDFYQAMSDRGFSADKTDRESIPYKLTTLANDPESAQAVPPEFWGTYNSLSTDAQLAFLAAKRPLPVAADCITDIIDHNIIPYARYIIDSMGLITDPADRQSYAQSLEQVSKQYPEPEAILTWSGLDRFQDPAAALALSARLFKHDRNLQTQIFNTHAVLVEPDDHQTPPAALDPGLVQIVEQAKAVLASLKIDNIDNLATIARLARLPDPELPAHNLIAALTQLENSAAATPDAARAVLSAYDPQATARVIIQYGNQLADIPGILQRSLFEKATKPDFPEAAAHFFNIITGLTSRKDAPHFRYPLEIQELIAATVDLPPARVESRIEDFINAGLAATEMRSYLTAEIPKVAIGEVKRPTPDTLDLHPKLEATLARLGIPDQVARLMYSAWASISVFGIALDIHGKKKLSQLSVPELRQGIEYKVAAITDQLQAVQDYIDLYGLHELLEVHTIFHTVNFRRSRPEQLHNQLQQWKNPRVAPKVIAASTYKDHNGAFNNDGTEIEQQFGEAGVFRFEFGTRQQLAQIMIEVGNRDRRQARDPVAEPTVKDVVISGHANPKGIRVAPGQDIDEAIYIKAAQKRLKLAWARPNTYTKHLGNAYRLVLNSCLAGRKTKGGQNIAQALNTGHGARVDASNYSFTRLEVLPDGQIFYHQDTRQADALKSPAVVYERATQSLA